jgi:hypothetical protein
MRANRAIFVAAALLALALALAASAEAQVAVDFSGTWRLSVEATEPVPQAATAPTLASKQGEPCVYAGTVMLTQDGAMVSGPVQLFLVSGPDSCPAEMSGNLTGTLSASDVMGSFLISGMIDGGDPSGVTSISGTLSPNPGGSGVLAVTQGGFAGTDGTWMAVLQQSVLEIPGLGPVGLALLTVLLLAAGAWILARSHPA